MYNQNADKVGSVSLPDKIFGLPMNADLLHQVVISQASNKRQNIAHTKERGDVRGGGKKPWKQKGTGRARHGSIRSPIWKGGGVTFGPRNERNFNKKINKKMARKALLVALSSKAMDKELVILDGLNFDSWKTREMASVINKISNLFPSKQGRLLFVIDKKMSDTVVRTTRNLPKVDVVEAKDLNALDVINRKNLLILKEAVGIAGNFISNK